MSPIKKVSDTSFNTDQSLLLAGSSFLILLVLAMIGLQSQQPPVSRTDTATMIFSFSGNKDRTFTGQVTDKMTVLEAVLASAQGDSIKVAYHIDDKNNLSLSSINNNLNLSNHQWSFYLNHALIKTEDINKVYVKTGDLVEAKYQ